MNTPLSHYKNRIIAVLFAWCASFLASHQLKAEAVYGDVTTSITELADLAGNDFISYFGAIREYDNKIFLTFGNTNYAALTSLASYDLITNKKAGESPWNRSFYIEQFGRMQIADGDLWIHSNDSKDTTEYYLRRTRHRLQTFVLGFNDFDYTWSSFIFDGNLYFGSSMFAKVMVTGNSPR
jgi:hypothetical protein